MQIRDMFDLSPLVLAVGIHLVVAANQSTGVGAEGHRHMEGPCSVGRPCWAEMRVERVYDEELQMWVDADFSVTYPVPSEKTLSDSVIIVCP